MKEITKVEVGIKLPNCFNYYQELIEQQGGKKVFSCTTHDIYWSKANFNGKTEKEIKDSCIRLRLCKKDGDKKWDASLSELKDLNPSKLQTKLAKKPSILKCNLLFSRLGLKKVFDTIKTDVHFVVGDMKSRIQLQTIEGIGLMVYYDNPKFYGLPTNKQREALINELNSYGFNIPLSQLGLDKLRTLYTGQEQYSENQFT